MTETPTEGFQLVQLPTGKRGIAVLKPLDKPVETGINGKHGVLYASSWVKVVDIFQLNQPKKHEMKAVSLTTPTVKFVIGRVVEMKLTARPGAIAVSGIYLFENIGDAYAWKL